MKTSLVSYLYGKKLISRQNSLGIFNNRGFKFRNYAVNKNIRITQYAAVCEEAFVYA